MQIWATLASFWKTASAEGAGPFVLAALVGLLILTNLTVFLRLGAVLKRLQHVERAAEPPRPRPRADRPRGLRPPQAPSAPPPGPARKSDRSATADTAALFSILAGLGGVLYLYFGDGLSRLF